MGRASPFLPRQRRRGCGLWGGQCVGCGSEETGVGRRGPPPTPCRRGRQMRVHGHSVMTATHACTTLATCIPVMSSSVPIPCPHLSPYVFNIIIIIHPHSFLTRAKHFGIDFGLPGKHMKHRNNTIYQHNDTYTSSTTTISDCQDNVYCITGLFNDWGFSPPPKIYRSLPQPPQTFLRTYICVLGVPRFAFMVTIMSHTLRYSICRGWFRILDITPGFPS